MDAKPNCTLYVHNLNEKVKKDELKRSLFHIFSQFGSTLDIVALKTIRMRGQAFIVFRDIPNASAALRSLQGCPFYNKPMKVEFAQSESEAIQKRNGTFKMKKKDEEPKESVAKRKKDKKFGDSTGVNGDGAGHFAAFADVAGSGDQDAAPNNILFVSNLPSGPGGSLETLTAVFGPHAGFKEVRMVPGREDICFVEFDSEGTASTARDSLNGFRITPVHPITISFAKR